MVVAMAICKEMQLFARAANPERKYRYLRRAMRSAAGNQPAASSMWP
jgi:hypothetical protein